MSDPEKTGHDKVEVKSAKVSADGRTVSLEVPGIRPVMQMRINLSVDAADDTPVKLVKLEVDNTINRVP